MMRERVLSYGTYAGGLGISKSIAGTGEDVAPVTEIVSQVTANNQQAINVLLSFFPDAVLDGTLTVVNGVIYFYGFSLEGLLGLALGVVTFTLMVFRFAYDMVVTRKTNELAKEAKDDVEMLKKLKNGLD